MSGPDLSPAALKAVAAHLPIMAAPDFQFTDGGASVVQSGPGHFEMLGCTYAPEVHRLLGTLERLNWVQVFPWPEWQQTPEARALLTDPAVLAQASPEQLTRLMTIFVREEHFADGAMLGFWESGLLLSILRRAEVLFHEASRPKEHSRVTGPLYSVTPQPIETILSWIKSGEIAIPEIQRPFVWEGSQVRNLLDSLYRGYPVGYLIAWKNPDVKLKDGKTSEGKRILIDGQQRVTALMASLLAYEVVNKDYKQARIRIAFHPVEEKFEVNNSAIQKDPAWIQDIATLFSSDADLFEIVAAYQKDNPNQNDNIARKSIQKLTKITTNQVGIIDLASTLDIETVTEIFIRVNSAGVSLSQADFVMSKIAANETYGGNTLRKAIDYFCHLAQHPGFLNTIAKDEAFMQSEFYPKLQWMGGTTDDIYDPSYVDMLRVAFTSEFGRGRLQDLVALLSGRNFETKQYEDSIAEQSFASLRRGIHNFIRQQYFEKFTMIIRSAGFVSADLISSQNAINFAYIMYLHGRGKNLNQAELEGQVRRWYALSILTGRYSGSPESNFDRDIRQIMERGLSTYVDEIVAATLTDSFWSTLLPQQMDTSSGNSPYFLAFQAAQVRANDQGFLSQAITVQDLLLNHTDVHHTYPADFLKKRGLTKGKYNQIANFVLTQQEINIAIGNKDPQVYFGQLREQVSGGPLKYGGITDRTELEANLTAHCIPPTMLDDHTLSYDSFLEQRRRLMALKLQTWFESL